MAVRQFRLQGNTLLTEAELQSLLAPWRDRTVSLPDLDEAAAAISQAYRSRGWLVRAFLPRQDVTDGSVLIQVVEARFGAVRLDGPAPARLPLPQLLAPFAVRQKPGAPVQADDLDRALLLADDLPGVAVSGLLQAGTQEGQTDLVLRTTDEPWLMGQADLDNTGARSTGADRLGLSLLLNSPTRRGDLAQVNLLHTQGSDYARLAWGLPVGADGLRVGLNASTLRYRLVAPGFQALNAHGTSDSWGATLSYPLLRSRFTNVYTGVNFDAKGYDNTANGATQSRYRVHDLTLTVSGNHFDRLGGGGANAAQLGLVLGQLKQGSLEPAENAALGGHFQKLMWSVSRQQALTGPLSLYASLAGQRASRALDSSERFYLGGATACALIRPARGAAAAGT